MRLLAGGIVAAILAALTLLGATPASADDADCAPTYLASNGRELFEIDDAYLPPALRGFPADCASRISDEPFDDSTGISFAYVLLYADVDFAEYTSILRAFEREGWITASTPTDIDTDSTGLDETATIAQLEALAQPPLLARTRLSSPNGLDLVELTYSSTGSIVVPTLTGPALTIDVLANQRYSTTRVNDPSVFSRLRTITEALPTPVQTGVIAGGAVALMLVVGWPAALLNSVVGSRYDALVRWVQGRFRRKSKPAASKQDAAPAPVPKGSRLPGWLMWPGFALAAIIGALVDPDFGWNPMSARVVATLFISFVLFNLATWAVVRVIARRLQPDSHPLLRFRWGSLLLVALAVLVARLLQLEPGVVFGLVAGVAYATALRASRSAIIALVGSGFGLVLALIAWVAYSLLAPVAATEPRSVPLIVGVEFLAAVTVKGVSSLPLALLPLGTLDGAKVFKWRRVGWAVAYAIGLAAFMLVLLTIPKAWGEIPGDFVRWLVLFGVYAIVAIVLWVVNARWVKRRPPQESPVGEQPDAITID
ncbi:MAG: hypothetical protein ABIQ01_03975 [Pseudolysinimonas sp.]